VFFDHSELVSLEIQTEKLSKVQVSVQGEQIRWFVIQGSTPKDVSYTFLPRAILSNSILDSR
jgi:alpha-D-xyloside xylohydrolase